MLPDEVQDRGHLTRSQDRPAAPPQELFGLLAGGERDPCQRNSRLAGQVSEQVEEMAGHSRHPFGEEQIGSVFESRHVPLTVPGDVQEQVELRRPDVPGEQAEGQVGRFPG